MKGLKKAYFIILLSLLIILLNFNVSNAVDINSLTTSKIFEWLQTGSSEYFDMDPIALINTYNINGKSLYSNESKSKTLQNYWKCIQQYSNGTNEANWVIQNVVDVFSDRSAIVYYRGSNGALAHKVTDAVALERLNTFAYILAEKGGINSVKVEGYYNYAREIFKGQHIYHPSLNKASEASSYGYSNLNAGKYRVRFLIVKLTGAGQDRIIYGKKVEENPKGNLKIIKTDDLGTTRLAGAEFEVTASDGVIYKGTTNSNGEVTFTGLPVGTCTIKETKAPTNYKAVTTSQTTTIVKDNTVSVTFKNEVKKSVLKLKKVDDTTGKGLANVGFTLKMVSGREAGKYVSINTNGVASYITSEYTLKTNNEGILKITGLWPGTYELIETVMPHSGYDNSKKVINSKLKIDANKTVEITVNNKRKYIDLSGKVWEDINNSAKEPEKNYLYNNDNSDINDKLLNNVIVRLVDASNNDEIIKEVKTDKSGVYKFENIEIDKLKDYYIEFEYNGMSYQSVVVTKDKNNGSKAADENRDLFNSNFAEIVYGQANAEDGNKYSDLTYERNGSVSKIVYGTNVVYGYEGAKYPIYGTNMEAYLITATTKEAYGGNLDLIKSPDQIRKEGISEITNINLGLQEREMPDISLVQDVQSAEITLNGYSHTYNYADRFSTLNTEIEEFKKAHEEDGEIFNIGVNFGQKYGPTSYTRTIYSSDIVYNSQTDGNGELDVFITYRIKLTNEASTVNTVINELYNYFDKDYKIIGLKEIEEGENETASKEINIEKSIEVTEYDDSFNKATIKIEGGIQIPHNSYKYLEITYEFNNTAIVKILNQDKTLDSITEVASYSSYDDENFTNRYAGIDRDSEPNNITLGDKETYEDDVDQAPSLILTASPNRVIAGTVWEENAMQELLEKEGYDKQRIGDGQYDKANEKVIKDVQVELLKLNDSGDLEIAKLYRTDNLEEGIDAKVQTNELGEYEFEGVIPGKYVIRFTYKNSSIICNTDGTQIGTLEEIEGGVDYYKSTLFRTKSDVSGNLDMEAYNKSESDLNWYVNETNEAERLSDARDNDELIEERVKIEEDKIIKYENANDSSERTEMFAETNQLEIRLDCNEDDLENISKFGQNLKYIFNNVDFGIIRRPKQIIDVKKEIAYVEVTLANGQDIIKGDPREGNLQHVKYLPDGNVHIELDSEIMQGANLKVTYDITVSNKESEVDYNYKDYYLFGRIPSSSNYLKMAQVVEVFDYPEALEFKEEDNPGWEYLKLNELEEGRLEENVEKVLKTYDVLLKTTEFADMRTK